MDMELFVKSFCFGGVVVGTIVHPFLKTPYIKKMNLIYVLACAAVFFFVMWVV